MNHKIIYDNLMSKSKSRPAPEGYLESHHILPRSLGGSDCISNIALLTAREHVFAHALLSKIHGGPMYYAYWMMVNGAAAVRAKRHGVKLIVSSRSVSIAREARAKHITETRSGENHHYYGKNRCFKVKDKISSTLISKYRNGYVAPSKGTKVTEQQRKDISRKLKILYADGMLHPMLGKKHTEEAKNKISNSQKGELNNNYGKPLSSDHARKISYAQVGIKNHNADNRILAFKHESGEEYTGYRSDFIIMYLLGRASIARLLNGKQSKHKGWFFNGVKK